MHNIHHNHVILWQGLNSWKIAGKCITQVITLTAPQEKRCDGLFKHGHSSIHEPLIIWRGGSGKAEKIM